jgi:hypothetical protein
MNNHKIKVEVTIDGDDATSKSIPRQVGSQAEAPTPSCSKGFAVYQYENEKLMRVGAGSCTDAVGGASNNWPTAWASISIGSALNYQLMSVEAGHPDFKDLRFVVCCGSNMASEVGQGKVI